MGNSIVIFFLHYWVIPIIIDNKRLSKRLKRVKKRSHLIEIQLFFLVKNLSFELEISSNEMER